MFNSLSPARNCAYPLMALSGIVLSPMAMAQGEVFQATNQVPAVQYVSNQIAIYTFGALSFQVRIDQMDVLNGRMPPPVGGSAVSTSDVLFHLTFNDGSSTINPTSNGQAVADFTDLGAGLYSDEMLNLPYQISLPAGAILVRESPTLASRGQTTIRPVTGGFMVSSFFDVFTELSIDGGQTWIPSSGSVRLMTVPEPAILVAIGLGLIQLGRRRRSPPLGN